MRIQSNARSSVSSASAGIFPKRGKNGFKPSINITQKLIDEISSALKNVDAYGSVEIYVQNSEVTQITTRTIRKTNGVHQTQ